MGYKRDIYIIIYIQALCVIVWSKPGVYFQLRRLRLVQFDWTEKKIRFHFSKILLYIKQVQFLNIQTFTFPELELHLGTL